MSIRLNRLADGTPQWIIDYYPEGRKGPRKRVRLPGDIPRKQVEAMEQELRRKNRPIFTAAVTLNARIADYLEHVRLYQAPKTHQDKRNTFHGQILPQLGGLKVSELTGAHLEIYARKRLDAGAGPRSVNKEASYLMAYLGWLKEQGITPDTTVSWKPLKYDKPPPTVLTPDEIERILAESSPFHRTLLLTAYALGIRRTELFRLRWDDIDFETGTVKILGKGRNYRLQPLQPWLADELRAHRERLKKPSEWIFPSPKTGKPLENVRKALISICERAGIEKNVTLHVFRHSTATHMLASAVNFRTISRYLGHKSTKPTEIYTHVDLELLRHASGTINIRVNTEE